MVLQMTGATWLVALMRTQRDARDAPPDEAWLLFGPSDPAIVDVGQKPTND